jgi:hypothetical protein
MKDCDYIDDVAIRDAPFVVSTSLRFPDARQKLASQIRLIVPPSRGSKRFCWTLS